ncbi:hypothetical protein [Sporichthya sp.]|uniref:hypothetical protein n=1 Tax=Sporichthya sp. TaxID=65475 RepID=UPI00180A929A|nr:hypothetical protein [Sporichthya sp.]MBA3743521.1 hypothetical protein [Sporichthya sp.]
MRLNDLLQPHLGGVHTVVEVGAGALTFGGALPLPPEVPRSRVAAPGAGDTFTAGTLVIAIYGRDPDRHGDPANFAKAAARMQPGAKAVLLFEHRIDAVPFHQVLEDLVGAALKVLEVGPLDHDEVQTAAVLVRVDPDDPTGAGLPVLLRLQAEHAFDSVVGRATRARLAELEAAQRSHTGGPSNAADVSDAAVTAKLRRTLTAKERQLQAVEERLTALEGSAAMVLGRTLVGAARNPRRGARLLPREVKALWRRRSGRTMPGAPIDEALLKSLRGPTALDVDEIDNADPALLTMLHTSVAVGPRTVPVIAGMLTAQTAALLRGPIDNPRAVVNTLLPHDAEVIVSRADPDVVLIESAALGSPGPWAYTTQSAYGARDRAILDVLVASRAVRRPVLIWWNSPRSATPGLARIGARADAVWTSAEWHPGTPAPEGAAPGSEALRIWFSTDAPAVRLAEFCTRMNFPFEPLARRRVGVVSNLPADAFANQGHAPARVVTDASAVADLPLVAHWDGDQAPPEHWLLDLVAAAEASDERNTDGPRVLREVAK